MNKHKNYKNMRKCSLFFKKKFQYNFYKAI